MKRYCQTLRLIDNPELVEKYVEAHRHVWPEIIQGQREVGILDMQIYRHGRNLFMICDTVDDFDWERDMARLATLPRQAEWEAYVAQFQGCKADARSDEKWKMMEKIFDSGIRYKTSKCSLINKDLIINKTLLDTLGEKARRSPRLRMHYDLRDSVDDES